MGLDMYLTGEEFVPNYDEDHVREKRDGFDVKQYDLELGYWRKFAPLHCYIVNEFAGGVDECQPIELSVDDLRQIASALRGEDGYSLPSNEDCSGFFFGNPEWWDEDRARGEEHALIFDRAAAWLADNAWRSVVYQASW